MADTGTQSTDSGASDAAARDEINKRLTLNWLIQGAAQHAGMTFHHLVRDELHAIQPKLLRLYDQFALFNILQYWRGEAVMLLGWPPRFWRRAASEPSHPFFGHALLSQFGGVLATAAKQRAIERAKEKGVTRVPIGFVFQLAHVMDQLRRLEAGDCQELIALAKKATAMVWGIPANRLDGTLTRNVAFGKLSRPRTFRALMLRASVVGYGGVMRRNGSLMVVARAANWQLLAKELVKGTAELICLHGLNKLNDATFQRVMRDADRIEFEPWMLQTGGELWRRLLAVLPDRRPLAEMLMHLARLPAKSLESMMRAVIEQPEWARELLMGLGERGDEPIGEPKRPPFQ